MKQARVVLMFVVLICSIRLFSADKPLCSSLSDSVCSRLWDAEHRGNMKTSDGEVMLGKSKKSNLVDLSTLEDRWALLEAESRLPKDLRNQSGPLLSKLRKILKEESETIPWARRYNRWDQQWLELISDVAQDRAIAKSPILKKTRLSERTQKEQILINREYYKLIDEVTVAKYANHSNWKRVVRLFEKIRSYLLEEIASFPYPDDFKQFLVKRVKAVELMLPLLDIDVFDGRKDCSETAVNAFYLLNYNKITVCTGLFNSLKSEASIYIILAHELSHSIDPSAYTMAWLKEYGVRSLALKPLIGIQIKPLNCNEWEKILAQLDTVTFDKAMKVNHYDSLAKCLDNNQALKKEFDPKEISRQVDEDLVEVLNYLANRNLFSNMVIPDYQEFGKQKKNPYFAGPEVFVSEFTGKGYVTSHVGMRSYPYSPEVFYQAVQCEVEKQKSGMPFDVFFTSGGSPQREEVLKKSIEQTKSVISKLYEESYFSCGQFCSTFVRKGMARNIDEKFADWMSFRIFSRFLKSQKTLEEKRSASSFALVNLCDRPSVRQEAGGLLNVEKTYSIESHPENRARRIGLYNREIADLLDCVPESRETWGSCNF